MRPEWLGFVAGSIAATMMLLPVVAATTPAAAQRPNYTLARLEASEPAHSQLARAEAQRRRDVNECVRAAIGAEERGPQFAFVPINREDFKRCMEARGYTSY